MIQYPEFFPCPTWSYGQQLTAFQRRTQFANGWARQRRMYPDFNEGLSFQFIMSTQLFERWAKWVDANGREFFRMKLDSFDGERLENTVRFVGGYEYTYDTFDTVTVTTQGELYDA